MSTSCVGCSSGWRSNDPITARSEIAVMFWLPWGIDVVVALILVYFFLSVWATVRCPRSISSYGLSFCALRLRSLVVVSPCAPVDAPSRRLRLSRSLLYQAFLLVCSSWLCSPRRRTELGSFLHNVFTCCLRHPNLIGCAITARSTGNAGTGLCVWRSSMAAGRLTWSC